MIALGDFIAFLCDVVFAYLFFQTTESSDFVDKKRKIVASLILLLTFPLYPVGFLQEYAGAWVRFAWRFVVYVGYVLAATGCRMSLALYASAFCATVCTVCHSIFLTPLTGAVLRGSVPITGIPLVNECICACLVNGFSVVVYAYVCRKLPLRQVHQVGRSRGVMVATITIMSTYLKATQLPLTYGEGYTSMETTVYFIVLQVALLGCLLLSEHYQRKLQESAAYRFQAATAQTLLNSIRHRQKKDLEVRQLRHDLKNHMLTLRTLIQSGEEAGALEYIDSFLGQGGQKEIQIRTGHSLLDALMEEKLAGAIKHQAEVHVMLDFSAGLFIEDFDLCVIMGNALDNAVESCLGVDRQDLRYIDIRGGTNANNLVVTIKNGYSGQLHGENGVFRTTKRDKELHGFGLDNIKRTVQKYRGAVVTDMDKEKREFRLTLFFPLDQEQAGE